jgi:hypothetical protein
MARQAGRQAGRAPARVLAPADWMFACHCAPWPRGCTARRTCLGRPSPRGRRAPTSCQSRPPWAAAGLRTGQTASPRRTYTPARASMTDGKYWAWHRKEPPLKGRAFSEGELKEGRRRACTRAQTCALVQLWGEAGSHPPPCHCLAPVLRWEGPTAVPGTVCRCQVARKAGSFCMGKAVRTGTGYTETNRM